MNRYRSLFSNRKLLKAAAEAYYLLRCENGAFKRITRKYSKSVPDLQILGAANRLDREEYGESNQHYSGGAFGVLLKAMA